MLLKQYIKYGAIGGSISIFGILFGYVIFPIILKSQLKKESALSEKTDLRGMWEHIPFPFEYKVYIFNYTNPEEVQKGAKPIVKEIGPYHFDLWKDKVEIQDHEEDDTITYRRKNTYFFKPEVSGPGLTGEEIVVIPHVFMLTMINKVYREKPSVVNVAGKAVNGIFDNPPDVFISVKVLDILFRGIIINCNRNEFAPKAACRAIRKEAADLLDFEPNIQFRFSLFGKLNATIDKQVLRVKRGIKNVTEVGRVVAINDEPSQSIWRDACNEYDGADTTVFHPMYSKKERLNSYYTQFCRPFRPWFLKKSKYHGIKTNRYISNVGDLANDPELQCYCEAPDKCLPKGIMNMTKCYKAPLFISMPHFLSTDESVLNNVKGLMPDIEQHGTIIDFEPISGTPMLALLRMQFNIELLKIKDLELTKNLPDILAPVWWVEEGSSLNKTFVKMMKKQLFIPKKMVAVMSCLMVLGGIIVAALPMAFPHKDKLRKLAPFNAK